MIIGLSGYARAGKDEAASALVSVGFRRISFADKVREFLFVLDPYIRGNNSRLVVKKLSELMEQYTWESIKTSGYSADVRRLLQRLGTDCGRDLVGENIWVDMLMNNAEGDVVIPDMRFPNEADTIRKHDGIVVRINRPGNGPVNGHISETALDDYDFDYIIENDGSLDKLHAAAIQLAI